MRFSGEKVVITGAAGVYGRELSAAFAAEGERLLLADRSEADLAAAVPAGLTPDRVTLHAADLATDAGIDLLIAAAIAGGAPAVLINNAGIYPFIPLMEVIRSNGVPYGASKCALEYLTRAFAIEVGPRGVRVNSARPPFAEGSTLVSMPPGYAEAVVGRSLLGRGRRPGAFADAVLFLCSDAADYITGSVLDVGGGGAMNRREGAATRARS